MSKLQSLVRSRRFWAAFAGVVAVAGRDLFGLDEAQTLGIAAVIGTWIWGDSQRPTE